MATENAGPRAGDRARQASSWSSSWSWSGILLACLLPPAFARADEDLAAADVPEERPEDDSADDDDFGPLPDIPVFETVVVGRRPVSRDRTEDRVEVSGERLRDSAQPSTLEALSREAADVYVPARGALHGVAAGATGGIHVRGLGGSPNSQVLVVEDGVPDYQGIFGHPIPDAYVPFLIDEALVVEGGDSVLYGTNAMGGAIVLRSRWRDREGWELHDDSAYGSYATLRETAALLGRFGDWDVAAAFHGLATDGHRDGAGGDEIVGNAAARWRPLPDLSLTLRNKVVHLTGADPGPVTHPHVDHFYDVWRDNASLRLVWDPGPVRLTAGPWVNVGVHRLHDGFHSVDVVAGGAAEVELPLGRTAEALLGLDARHVDGEVENRITDERLDVRAATDVSVYGQLTLRPLEALAFVLGARAVFGTVWDDTYVFKTGARWDVWEGLYVRARLARNYRQPTLRELYLPFPTANPDLRPERSLSGDVGAGWESEHVEASCSVWRTRAEDMIRYFGAWPTAEVVNIDHLTIWGVEGRVGVRRLGPVSAHVAAGWQDVGRYTRQNPEAKLDFEIEAFWDVGAHRVGGAVGGEWVHGLYMANYGREPIADAFVMDLAVRYRWASPSSDLTLEPYLFLRNFLDRSYAYVAGYPMPGFHVLAGLRVGL